MAHVHHSDVEVVDHDRSAMSGVLVAVVALLLVALVAFAVLWTRPWDGSSGNGNRPAISDNSGGGQTGGGSSGSDSSGGSQPAP